MVRKGIHPLLHTLRVVLRNGASFQMKTTMRRTNAYMLQVDTTTNPVYTGEAGGLSTEDARLQKLISRYGDFLAEEAGSGAAAAGGDGSPLPQSSGKAGGGKGKKKK